MYEQQLPIEEWKAKKQAELKETIAAQKSVLQEVVQDGQRLADYLYGRGRLGSHITSGNAALVLQTLPQARAVLTAKDWDKFGRRVNKGAKGIPQLVRVNGYYNVGSIFDVSMTYGNKPYPIPEIKPEQMDKAIKELERLSPVNIIQDTFWTMHEITYEVEEVDITPEPTEDDPDPEQQTDYILHITVSSKTVDELAELYNFTQDQKDILHELLSDEMRPTLLALCGGIGIIEDGELCWPLPGHTYISCNFGDDDAYGNSGHRGTDIPAPEGTPILAAHSGTVIISGWNNSYGNQVLLDNGAGLSTRYAHMTQTAVAAGEAVTAGQVIGYVGNTGDSTGFHLHFEVMQNGVRVNPLDAVTPQ